MVYFASVVGLPVPVRKFLYLIDILIFKYAFLMWWSQSLSLSLSLIVIIIFGLVCFLNSQIFSGPLNNDQLAWFGTSLWYPMRRNTCVLCWVGEWGDIYVQNLHDNKLALNSWIPPWGPLTRASLIPHEMPWFSHHALPSERTSAFQQWL